jgi:hypothetical protein
MWREADLTRSGADSGQRAVLKPAAPGIAAGLLAAVAILNLWDAGTTSQRHAE